MQWIRDLLTNKKRIEELEKERDILSQELHQIYKEKEDLHREQRELELLLENVQNQYLSEYDFNYSPPVQLMTRKITNDEYIIHASCPICLERFEYNVEYPLLQCGHIFHQECIDRWLENNEICPVCRQFT